MKKLIFYLFCGCLVSCHWNSTATSRLENNLSVIQTAESSLYHTACLINWEEGENHFEAKVEILNSPLPPNAKTLPVSRLQIKNLTNEQLIYARDEGDSFLSMGREILNDEIGDVLVLKWSAGSAARMEIFAFDNGQAKQIFYESYRVDAAIINLVDKGEGDNKSILLTTSGGASKIYTTRFVWKNGKFEKAGKVNFEKLTALFSDH